MVKSQGHRPVLHIHRFQSQPLHLHQSWSTNTVLKQFLYIGLLPRIRVSVHAGLKLRRVEHCSGRRVQFDAHGSVEGFQGRLPQDNSVSCINRDGVVGRCIRRSRGSDVLPTTVCDVSNPADPHERSGRWPAGMSSNEFFERSETYFMNNKTRT